MTDLRVQLFEAQGDPFPLLSRLDTTRILVRAQPETAVLSLSLVNLLVRLFPNVAIEASPGEISVPVFGDGDLATVAARTIEAAREVHPTDDRSHPPIVVDVGPQQAGANLYVASDGWTVELSTEPLVARAGSGPGNVAASALAAAEIFRMALPELPGVRLRETSFVWNLVDYQFRRVNLPETEREIQATCFGAGSVGSSIVYALLTSDVAGQLEVVDPDRLSPRNKLRYPLYFSGAGTPKVKWLEGLTKGSELKLRGHAMTASAHITDMTASPKVAVAAVDSVPARRDIVDAFAETTFNVGVDGMRFHVSRHHFGDGLACLYCPYVATGEALDEGKVYEEMTGLSHARVLELLAGKPLEKADIQAMKAAGRIGVDVPESELVGGRIQDAARARLYAQAALRVGDTTLAIPAPFVSALSGSLVASELIKAAAGGPLVDRRLDIDCTGYPTGFLSRPPQDSTGRCLCHDTFRLDEYRRQW